MATSKPCFGYPSRTAAIAAMRADGHDTAAIAASIGIKVSAVSALECSAERHHNRPRAAQRPRRSKLSDAMIADVCAMRERGLSTGQIRNKLASQGIEIAAGAIEWYCLREGADLPKAKRKPRIGVPASPIVMRRGFPVRSYSEQEDQQLLEMIEGGSSISEICQALNRRSNSIVGRLRTLARHDARKEEDCTNGCA